MRAKLSSSSGITIVLAMSIFLLVTIFSVTMLTGALNAAFSSEWQRRQEAQSYLTATSAAMILERLLSEPDAEALIDSLFPVSLVTWEDHADLAKGTVRLPRWTIEEEIPLSLFVKPTGPWHEQNK